MRPISLLGSLGLVLLPAVAAGLPQKLFWAATSGSAGTVRSTAAPPAEIGSDAAADPATTAFMTNHVSFNVANLTASMDFYTRVLGFRWLFTYHVSEHFSFTYLAHASGGKNGTAYQTTAEMLREKNLRQGLIEMQFFNDPAVGKTLAPSTRKVNTFSHIGVIMPDLTAALSRFEAMGVNVIFKPGDTPKTGGHLATAMDIGFLKADDPEGQAILAAFGLLGVGLIFLEDPDGNMVEVLPQNENFHI